METEKGEETKVVVSEPQTQEPSAETISAPETPETPTQPIDWKVRYEQEHKGLRTAQSTIKERDRKLKEYEDLHGRIDGIETMLGFLASEKDSGSEEPGLTPEKRPGAKQTFDLIVAKRKQAAFDKKVGEYETRTEMLGLDKKSVEYKGIQALVISGSFGVAEEMLEKLEGQKEKEMPAKPETKDEKKVETPEQMAARLRKDIEKEILTKHGLLNAETGQPSGGGGRTFTQSQIADREFYEANREEIIKSHREGRIKPD